MITSPPHRIRRFALLNKNNNVAGYFTSPYPLVSFLPLTDDRAVRQVQLLDDFGFMTAAGILEICKAGFISDGGTIPLLAQALIREERFGLIFSPALIHDKILSEADELLAAGRIAEALERAKYGNAVLSEALQVVGMPQWKIDVIFQSVSLHVWIKFR